MSNGIFCGMFDFDHDGNLDTFEQAAEFQFLDDMVLSDDEEDLDFESEDDYDFEDEF